MKEYIQGWCICSLNIHSYILRNLPLKQQSTVKQRSMNETCSETRAKNKNNFPLWKTGNILMSNEKRSHFDLINYAKGLFWAKLAVTSLRPNSLFYSGHLTYTPFYDNKTKRGQLPPYWLMESTVLVGLISSSALWDEQILQLWLRCPLSVDENRLPVLWH